jgi:hypothetical protein
MQLSALILTLGGLLAAPPGENTTPTPATVFTITLSGDDEAGNRRTETRRLSREQAIAEGLLLAGDAELPPDAIPLPPAPDALPATITRVVLHEEKPGWRRQTRYSRTPGGQWTLQSSELQSTRDTATDR